MSGTSGSGVPPPVGVVCNSALSFVASAQALPTENNVQANLQENTEKMAQADIIPVGLKALCDACSRLYPDQQNPLQVTTKLKYWLGGSDPLDYISMYWNPGRPDEHIPPHWHYISFGLSDLHGDGRVHPTPTPDDPESGYGFEITYRLASEESAPPLWPAALCQALARYVFTTGNKFRPGDHISWPLPGPPGRKRPLLVAEDPALAPVSTPHGTVTFLQIVGCTSKELKAAQRGSGLEVLRALKEDPDAGGPYLVTRPSRQQSSRALPPTAAPLAPAPLAGVSCAVHWLPLHKSSPPSPSNLPMCVEQEIKDTLTRGLSAMYSQTTDSVTHMSTDSFEMSSMEKALPKITDSTSSSREDNVQIFDAVHIFMDRQGAGLIPLALDGRIKFGGHFSWCGCGCAVSAVSPAVRGAFVGGRALAGARGTWLQVIITEEISKMLKSQYAKLDLDQNDSDSETETTPPPLPVTISAKHITITVTD